MVPARDRLDRFDICVSVDSLWMIVYDLSADEGSKGNVTKIHSRDGFTNDGCTMAIGKKDREVENHFA